MVAKHSIKVNGIWYRAGEEISPAKTETKTKDDFSQYMNLTEIEEESTEVKYTKTEINRMSTADLKELAKLNGIDDSLIGAEIKKALIERFGL